MLDTDYLKDCELALSCDSINIYAPSELVALALRRSHRELCQWAVTFKKSCVQIFSPDFPSPYHISASLYDDDDSEENNMPFPISVPQLDIDLNEIYNNTNPVYITSLMNLEVLFVNPAGLNANQHSLRQFRGQSATSLNDPQELEKRREHLLRRETLSDYSYRALRWTIDQDTGLYRRKEMDFVSSFRPIGEFFGEPCYVGEVLSAIETGTIFR